MQNYLEKQIILRILMYIRNINKLKPIKIMKLVNISLNVLFGSLSVICLSGITYAVGLVIINLV